MSEQEQAKPAKEAILTPSQIAEMKEAGGHGQESCRRHDGTTRDAALRPVISSPYARTHDTTR